MAAVAVEKKKKNFLNELIVQSRFKWHICNKGKFPPFFIFILPVE